MPTVNDERSVRNEGTDSKYISSFDCSSIADVNNLLENTRFGKTMLKNSLSMLQKTCKLDVPSVNH